MVRGNARRFATREAVVDGGVRLTFADVERDMSRVGAALLASGVAPGDRIALWAPNSASWIGAALGILAAGAWLVPVNTRFKGDEVAGILARTDARLLFTVDEFLGTHPLGMLRQVAPGHRASRDAVLLPGPGADDAPGWHDFLARGDDVPSTPGHPTTCATCSSRRAPRALPKASCCGTVRACAATRSSPRTSASTPATGTSCPPRSSTASATRRAG
jgi:non-ribosomal peptide synthetase component E (peptide arylation enzyme)